jgi:murein DD-endopeptidase MepM/ murein hydrolase activator NlpD
MKIIIVDQKHGETKTLVFKGWTRALLTVCLLGIPVVLGYYGYQFSASRNVDSYNNRTAQAWAESLGEQEQEIEEIKRDTLSQLQALTLKMASLQARLLRLDALGQRITTISDIDEGEFDFTQPPAVGGPSSSILPEIPGSELNSAPDLIKALDALSRQINDRQQQLEILDGLLSSRQNQSNTFLAGSPVRGYISSLYGRRIDPFTGEPAWHKGVDFATGRVGVEVETVASGVVTFAGERQGYGLMVEVNHGNGYETWYAHDQEVLVNSGDIVKKGQVIALSGNSGRSTGPHVHFEVHKNGRVVDPASYIHRTNR